VYLSEEDVVLKLGAWVEIDSETSIQYHTCVDQEVEFYIGGADGLNVLATRQGLEKLVAATSAALRAVEPTATAD
jgi:hypothetical protein